MSDAAHLEKPTKRRAVTVEVWTPSPTASLQPEQSHGFPQLPSDFFSMRKAICAFVIGAHLAGIWGLAMFTGTRLVKRTNSKDFVVRFLQSPVIAERVVQTGMKPPDVALDETAIVVSVPTIQVEQRASSQSGITAPFTAPRIQPGMLVNQLPFKERAPWLAGQRTRVVLIVDVAVDGSATDVEVETSTGDPNVDAIAVAYAQTLRWIPATINGQAALVRTRLVVSMVASA